MNDLYKKNIQKLLWFLLLVIGTIYVMLMHHKSIPYQHENGRVFGTFYNVCYACDSSIQQEIEKQLMYVNNSLSAFNENSTLSRLNRGETIIVDSMFAEVFNIAQNTSRLTDGAFDISVAPMVNAWGFGWHDGINVTQQTVDSLLQIVGYEKVRMVGDTLYKQDVRTMLDMSAIAKGYGVDVVAKLFKNKGIENYMIEIGGEIVAHGLNDSGQKWNIGVNKPIDDSLGVNTEIETIIQTSDIAIATSGNYHNFYYKNGRKYAHTIDPRTGMPIQHSLLSATVIAPTCARADALATAMMVMGVEKAKSLVEKLQNIEALLIYTDTLNNYRLYVSPGAKKLIKH